MNHHVDVYFFFNREKYNIHVAPCAFEHVYVFKIATPREITLEVQFEQGWKGGGVRVARRGGGVS